MKILLYGLGEKEVKNVHDRYGNRYEIIDETGAFTDVIAIPADAVILDPDRLTEEEKDAFSEVFQYDMDTKIILNHDVWEKEKFPHCGYYCVENLADTEEIEPLEDKLTEKVRYQEAEARIEQVLERSRRIILPQEDYNIESRIAFIDNQCIGFELLCSQLEKMRNIRPRDKVDFRKRLYELLENFQ